jgi:hypothetical protein
MSFVAAVRGRSTRVSFVALCAAALWSALLVVGAFVVPVYSGETCPATVEPSAAPVGCTSTSGTLVGVNGLTAVVVMSFPLLVTLLVGACLWSGSRGGRSTAWAVVGLLAVLTLLAFLSVGIVLLPVTVALVVACAAARVVHPGVDASVAPSSR